jgi:hypothetical protein
MRKVGGVLLAVAMVLPLGLIASPAGAAGGTSCATASGKATFKPPLPPLTSKTTVLGTFTAVGTLGKCVGGGVTSAHSTLTSVKGKTGSNCKSIATPAKAGTHTATGNGKITWNTGATSTVTWVLDPIKGKSAINQKLTAKVTVGLFKGMTQTISTVYAIPAGACGSKPLSFVTYKQTSPAVIK